MEQTTEAKLKEHFELYDSISKLPNGIDFLFAVHQLNRELETLRQIKFDIESKDGKKSISIEEFDKLIGIAFAAGRSKMSFEDFKKENNL